MKQYDFWTHGSATQVDSTKKFHPTSPVRNQNGMKVSMLPSTKYAWFYIPIPTPTVFAGNREVFLDSIILHINIFEDAMLSSIKVIDGVVLVKEFKVDFKNTRVHKGFKIEPLHEVEKGVVIAFQIDNVKTTKYGHPSVEVEGGGAIFMIDH